MGAGGNQAGRGAPKSVEPNLKVGCSRSQEQEGLPLGRQAGFECAPCGLVNDHLSLEWEEICHVTRTPLRLFT